MGIDQNPKWVQFVAMTAADIIDALGGPATVSKSLGIPTTTVGNWRARNSIPARHHFALICLSDGTLTADQIVAAHAGVTAPHAGASV